MICYVLLLPVYFSFIHFFLFVCCHYYNYHFIDLYDGELNYCKLVKVYLRNVYGVNSYL